MTAALMRLAPFVVGLVSTITKARRNTSAKRQCFVARPRSREWCGTSRARTLRSGVRPQASRRSIRRLDTLNAPKLDADSTAHFHPRHRAVRRQHEHNLGTAEHLDGEHKRVVMEMGEHAGEAIPLP